MKLLTRLALLLRARRAEDVFTLLRGGVPDPVDLPGTVIRFGSLDPNRTVAVNVAADPLRGVYILLLPGAGHREGINVDDGMTMREWVARHGSNTMVTLHFRTLLDALPFVDTIGEGARLIQAAVEGRPDADPMEREARDYRRLCWAVWRLLENDGGPGSRAWDATASSTWRREAARLVGFPTEEGSA